MALNQTHHTLAAPLFGLVAAGFAGPTTIAVPYGPFLWLVAGVLSYWLIAMPKSVSEIASVSGPCQRPVTRRQQGVNDRPARAPELVPAGAAQRPRNT